MKPRRKTVNELLRDAQLVHLINLHRLANSEVRQALSVLREADVKLMERLVAALSTFDRDSFSVKRLDQQLAGVWSVNEAAYRQLAQRNEREMAELTKYELQHQEALFNDLLPEGAPRVNMPSFYQVNAAAQAKPFQGRLLSEWFDDLAAGKQRRVTGIVRTGFVTGSTIDEMVRELRGTKAQNYSDGALQIDRRNAEMVVRSAVSQTAAVAREAFYEDNADIISAEQWVSTLDNRTTHTCMIRDGLLYTPGDHDPIDHKVPWEEGPGAIHWGCRSTSIPVLRSAEVLGIKLDPVERAAMNGVAAPETRFRDWIEDQSAARQDDILGATRGELLRSGNLTLEKFFNDKGEFLTLDDLRERESSAFRRAGL